MWAYIIAGIGVLALIAYIGVLHGEVSHYKTAAAESEAKYTLYVQESNATHAALKSAFDAVTLKYKQTLVASFASEQSKVAAVQKEIQANEELNRIKLSASAVRVLNGGTSTSEPSPQDPPAAKQGNDDSGDQGVTPTGDSVSLAEIFAVVKTNELNQNKCVDALTEWQRFWQDFSTSVERVGG